MTLPSTVCRQIQARTRISEYRDFITDRANRWQIYVHETGYGGHCTDTLLKAVQQRGGGQRAVALIKESSWAGDTCFAANETSGFYSRETQQLDKFSDKLKGHDFISARDLHGLDIEMAEWKQREQELNDVMVRLVGHTADHAVCYENHDSADPKCVASGKAIDAEIERLNSVGKFASVDVIKGAPYATPGPSKGNGQAAPPGQPHATSGGCPSYTNSAATISPCKVAPGESVTVKILHAQVVPRFVSFLTGVNNGIAVGGLVEVTGTTGDYSFPVPPFLCTAGSNSVFAVRLQDTNGTNQGEIGKLTVDCRTQH